jgi:hypothetical protein
LEIHVLLVNLERLGKSPQDARIQDEPFGRVRINLQIVGDLTAKPAKLIINGILEPERENVRPQLPFDPFPQSRHRDAPRGKRYTNGAPGAAEV